MLNDVILYTHPLSNIGKEGFKESGFIPLQARTQDRHITYTSHKKVLVKQGRRGAE